MSAEEAAPNGATTNAPALEPVIDSVRSSMTDKASEKLSAVEDKIQRKLDIDSVRSSTTDTVSEKLSAVEDKIQRKLDIDSVRSSMTDTVSEKLSAVEDKIPRKLDIDSVRSSTTDTVSEKLSAVEDKIPRKLDIDSVRSSTTDTVSEKKIQRKLCGVGEKYANKAKVAFILLTGLLALVEAVLISTTNSKSVYINMDLAFESAGDKQLLDETFEWSEFLPSCISDKPGIGGYDKMSPPSTPPSSNPALPPPPAGETASPPPPALPPLPASASGQAIAALTSNQSLINLWYSDTDECKDDPLFSGEATVDDCGPQPKWCGACNRDTIEAAGFTLSDDEFEASKPDFCAITHPLNCSAGSHDTDLWKSNWQEWKQCEQYVSRYFGMQLSWLLDLTVKHAIRGLSYFFTITLFLSAVCYTGARIALHYLTMRDSRLCDCCPGCIRTCLRIFLKKGAPVALNSLMIVNTKMAWQEGGKNGVPSHVYGYSLGFAQLELFFFFVNVLFMVVFVLVFFMLVVAPTCCAGMIKICCKACGGGTNAMRNAVKRVQQCARGYLVLVLYILSFWGIVTMIVTAAIQYEDWIGLDIPSSPSIAFQSFPLTDIAMTLFMYPPNLAVQLDSVLPRVRAVGVLRICKVISVCIPFGIDIYVQLLGWKYSAPPCKCCTKCFPCCGQGDMPQQGKGLNEIKVEVEGAITDAAAEAEQTATEIKVEVEGAITDAAAEAEQTATELTEINVQDRLVEETEKLKPQLEENASADLQALKDAAPTSSRDSLKMAKDWAWEMMSGRASTTADSEEQKASERLSGTSAPSRRLSI